MKILNFVTTMSIAITLAVPVSAQAQGYAFPNSRPTQKFLGLPIPQQWNNIQPAARPNHADQTYRGNSYYAPSSGRCVNGQCRTGDCVTGNCPNRRSITGYRAGGRCAKGNCVDCNCPDGACANGLCASGRCPSCVNGRCAGCTSGQCAGGQSVSPSCPNGRCSLNRNLNSRDNYDRTYESQTDWSPARSRSNIANPMRGAESSNGNDDWTPRPSLRAPLSDLYPTRYNDDDLDLRRPYFHKRSGELNHDRSDEDFPAAADIRAPRPSNRSMFTAPSDRTSDAARI